MKLEQKTVEAIKTSFDNMQDVDDLLKLINNVNTLLYTKTKPLKLQQLTYYAYSSTKKYSVFKIMKKSGGTRMIFAPNKSLKHILKTLNIILQCVYKPQKAAHGFVQMKSVVTNAQHHVGKNYVYNIDLKDFFPSIHQARVWKRIQMPPFNLTGDRQNIANLIAGLTCYQYKNVNLSNKKHSIFFQDNLKVDEIKSNFLPQGSPTSPTISNIICDRLDKKLFNLAKRFNAKYTRYADDITFSSMHNIYQENSDFLIKLYEIIHEQNFEINPEKTRLQKRGYKQEVTGIIVNDKTNVTRRYVKQLRAMLYAIEKFGIEKAQKDFKKHYKNEKGVVKKGTPDMMSVLKGKLEYLKMVKGEEDSTYNKLKHRFNSIGSSGKTTKVENTNFSVIRENECFGLKEYIARYFVWIKNYVKKYVSSRKQKLNAQEDDIEKILHRHDPKTLVSLLSTFTNNKILKFTVHEWDIGQEMSYDNFIDSVDTEWRTIQKELYSFDKNLNTKIYTFLLRDDHTPWGSHAIPLGWKSPEFKDWCQKNPEKSPFNFPLDERVIQKISSKGREFKTFRDIADAFNREIEFRDDNHNFNEFLMKLISSTLGKEFDLELDKETRESLDEARFFTNIQKLEPGLKAILNMISSRKQNSTKIQLKTEENDEYFELRIVHLGSFSRIEPKRIVKKVHAGGGDFDKPIENLCSLCDFSIESVYRGKGFRINFLKSKDIDEYQENIQNIKEEFRFILRFYYT
ncbi:reverse transcriptase domain-containing protein [Campylobacterota bacterium]